MNDDKAKVTIGIPAYNASKTIHKALDAITKQTFVDYHVFISDNASTDDTEKICRECVKKNNRISYFRQLENIGALNNFNYILNSATTEYFIWLATDDWWEPTFLEKNIAALESNKEFVGSNSKVDFYDIETEEETNPKSNIKKDDPYKKYHDCKTYEDRVSFYLRLRRGENLYGLYRTEILKKCAQKCLQTESIAMDIKTLMYAQRFGEINLQNENLVHRSGKGMTSKNMGRYNLTRFNDYGSLGKIFPFLSFSLWVFRNLGAVIFFRNLDFILRLNGSGSKHQLRQFLSKKD